MKVRYEDKNLQRLAEEPDFRSRRWSPELTRSYRRKIQILQTAHDERDLRRMKSLHLEQLRGDRSGTSSIRLNKQYRLVIRFETSEDGRIAVVIEMVDYH